MHYIEKVTFFFTANDLLIESKRQAIFLSVISAKHWVDLKRSCQKQTGGENVWAIMERHMNKIH